MDFEYLKKDAPGYYNAIETDEGVLLFSRTEEGKELFLDTMGKYLDNFYNPSCDTACFNLHYIKCGDGGLEGKSDLAGKSPKAGQPGFPVNPEFFTGKEALKYSLQKKKFSWEPTPYAASSLANESWDKKYLPMKPDGDTFNISVLKEIASGELYYFTSLSALAGHGVPGFDGMEGFKYKDGFRELAGKAVAFSGHIRQYEVIKAMRDKAGGILERDYPNIREGRAEAILKREHVSRTPSGKQKKGRGL